MHFLVLFHGMHLYINLFVYSLGAYLQHSLAKQPGYDDLLLLHGEMLPDTVPEM